MTALFENRFRFGIDHATEGKLIITAGTRRCWRCKARTRIVTGVTAHVGPYELEHGISGVVAASAERIHDALRRETDITTVLERASATLGRSYLNNACSKCGDLMGIIGMDYLCSEGGDTVASIDSTLDAETKNMLAFETRQWAVWHSEHRTGSQRAGRTE